MNNAALGHYTVVGLKKKEWWVKWSVCSAGHTEYAGIMRYWRSKPYVGETERCCQWCDLRCTIEEVYDHDPRAL